LLLAFGADLNAREYQGKDHENGHTPLTKAVSQVGHYLKMSPPETDVVAKRRVETVRALLDAGAPPDTRYILISPPSRTPLEDAIWIGHEALVQLLLKAGATCRDDDVSQALSLGHDEIAYLLRSKLNR
jgi:ankyrin repeat protein